MNTSRGDRGVRKCHGCVRGVKQESETEAMTKLADYLLNFLAHYPHSVVVSNHGLLQQSLLPEELVQNAKTPVSCVDLM